MYTTTTNSAVTYQTSGNALVDLFAQAAAMRSDQIQAVHLFEKAYHADALGAIRTMFYLRDIRGGQGERTTFRSMFNWLSANHPDVASKLLHLIPEYGRWDDLLHCAWSHPVRGKALNIFAEQLAKDYHELRTKGSKASISLAAKWAPSENASSKLTKEHARELRRVLCMDSRTYRKVLTEMRKHLRIVEASMSANNWETIEYSNVPSQASRIYRNAFLKHDTCRFKEFLQDVSSGKSTVNANATFPYEIVRDVQKEMRTAFYDSGSKEKLQHLNNLWNALPDYFDGKQENSIVVADTSGSMAGLPLDVCLSLAIYAAERNTGPFHGKFITFSARPDIQTIKGDTLDQKVRNLSKANWDMNTNVELVFNRILNYAVQEKVPPNQMVARIYIVSDMEFDEACSGRSDKSLFEEIGREYASKGYVMPELVFWNVNSSGKNVPMRYDATGVVLVSGASPSIFKNLLAAKENITPETVMWEILNSPRYASISI